jgi:hypothetical protein
MNLAELRRLVTAYSGRTDPDFLTHVDDFIRFGHAYVERAWSGREHYFTAWVYSATVPAGTYSVELPVDYRPSAHLSVHVTPADTPEKLTRPLERVPIEAMAEDRPWRLSDGTVVNLYDDITPGEPRAFAVFRGRELTFRPISDAALLLVVNGSGWTDHLYYDSDETVLTLEVPEAVMYAALREAWSFLGDPVQKATWEGEAQRVIDQWMRDGTQQETGNSGLPLVMQVPG